MTLCRYQAPASGRARPRHARRGPGSRSSGAGRRPRPGRPHARAGHRHGRLRPQRAPAGRLLPLRARRVAEDRADPRRPLRAWAASTRSTSRATPPCARSSSRPRPPRQAAGQRPAEGGRPVPQLHGHRGHRGGGDPAHPGPGRAHRRARRPRGSSRSCSRRSSAPACRRPSASTSVRTRGRRPATSPAWPGRAGAPGPRLLPEAGSQTSSRPAPRTRRTSRRCSAWPASRIRPAPPGT